MRARARARGVVQILCRFIEHTVAIRVALFWLRKKEKNSGGIDVKMNGPFYLTLAAPSAHVRSRFSVLLASNLRSPPMVFFFSNIVSTRRIYFVIPNIYIFPEK